MFSSNQPFLRSEHKKRRPIPRIFPAQLDTQSSTLGQLRVNITSAVNNHPVEGAVIRISIPGQPDSTIEEARTNNVGQTEPINLPAPPVYYSMEPFAQQPYADYVITISAPGFERVVINGAQVLSQVTAIQNMSLIPMVSDGLDTAESFVIPPHTLFGDFPPKIIEDEIKPVLETGEIVLPSVVIPEFIIVHDGVPSDTSASNYYVPYRDYIKNVASSEIYATWPTDTIYANILAIQSFTLNRVFTEWYRGRGYNFTITSSTAYDHKWVPNRNIFDTINSAVDDVFNNFLSRPGIRQPILTQYCDGKRVICPGVMSQWGSNTLGEQGYSSIQILRYFYGDNMYINETNSVSGVPTSFPGYALTIGSSGEAVRILQEQLNAIADVYYPIPNIAIDGIYGSKTAEAVTAFQKQFGLPQTGITNFTTWYKISGIYVAITRIAEYM